MKIGLKNPKIEFHMDFDSSGGIKGTIVGRDLCST